MIKILLCKLGRQRDENAAAGAIVAAERGQRLQTVDYEEALRDKMIVGTPDQVAEKLERLRLKIGLDGILAELNPCSLIPHTLVVNALRLLCLEVMPRFH